MNLLRIRQSEGRFRPNRIGNCKLRRLFLAFLAVWLFVLPAQAALYSGGGTAGDPFIIDTAAKMNDIGLNQGDWDKHFELTADIDLSGYTGTQFNIIGNTTTSFTGVFNGNFHIISNFTYTSAGANSVGIFGVAGGSSDMEIRDLGLDNPNVNAGTGDNVGAIVGQLLSRGYVRYCSVAGGSVSGNNNVGGIMGYGNQMARVYYSRSTANVSGTDSVGGLIGKSYDYGTIYRSYSAGSVSGTTNTGGLLGLEDGYVYPGGTVLDSFWDTQASGQPNSPGGGTPKNTAEMQDVNTFLNAGWDFVGYTTNGVSDIWAEPPGGGYPILWFELSPWPALPSFSGGSGTFGDPYLISTPAQLNSLGYNPRLMSAHFKLIDDIDLTGVDFWMIGNWGYEFTGTFDGNSNEILNFTYDTLGTTDAGIFSYVDGPDAEIKDLGLRDPNVDIGSEPAWDIGPLVGDLVSGIISNCYVEGGSVTGYACVGGLVGDCRSGGTLINCYATCSVSATNHTAAGLVGENKGTITDCYATGNVSGWGAKGGLTGSNWGTGTISNCYATGNVSPSEHANYVGGLTGSNSGTISNCHATGSILNGQRGIGGLVGLNGSSGTIDTCYAIGNVAATGPSGSNMSIGGLVGENRGAVADSYAASNISGQVGVGGLVGDNATGATVTNSYSTGSVSGRDIVGGLVGWNDTGATVTDSYSTANVSGIGDSYSAGGLVGQIEIGATVTNSYSTGSVSGLYYVGGLIGYNSGATVTACFWDKQTSEKTISAGGTGKTTAQMQTRSTFTSAGWDFLGESVNGTEDIWRLCADLTDYPRFVWQKSLLADFLCPDGVDALDLAFFLERWLADDCNGLNGYCDGADLNRGGEVDGKDYGLFAGYWSGELIAWVLYEDFETGDFSKYDWQHSGDANWVVVSDVNYEGSYCAKSGPISHLEQAVLEISVNTGIGSVSFYCKVSSEADEDYLRFYIDDVLQGGGWSGEQDWSLQEFALDAGPHTLKWLYMKDGSVSSGSDCAWIDKITVMGARP